MEKYLQILGISYGLSFEEVKKVYRKKSMEYHPDRNAGFKKEAEKKMKEINEAFEYIKSHFDEYNNYTKKDQYNKEDVKTKECPYCSEKIPFSSKECEYCGELLDKEKNNYHNYNNTSNVNEDNKKTKHSQKETKKDYKSFSTYYDNNTSKIKLIQFKGRINRINYILFMLALLPLCFISVILTLFGFGLIIAIWLVIAVCSLIIRRLHDMNIGGHLAFFWILMFPIAVPTMMIVPGTNGDNRFGPINRTEKSVLIVIITLIIMYSSLYVLYKSITS